MSPSDPTKPLIEPTLRFAGHWEWCETCRRPFIRCDLCGHASCSGGGCDPCFRDFKDAGELVNQIIAGVSAEEAQEYEADIEEFVEAKLSIWMQQQNVTPYVTGAA